MIAILLVILYLDPGGNVRAMTVQYDLDPVECEQRVREMRDESVLATCTDKEPDPEGVES